MNLLQELRKQLFPPDSQIIISDIDTFEEEINSCHGRIERRRIISCPMPALPGWESVRQCFMIYRLRINKRTNKDSSETVFGITSLPPERANAKRLLGLNRRHWGIENQLHWVRDTVFREDDSTLRSYAAQSINAACNSLAIFLLKQAGFTSITDAIETCADDKSIPLSILNTS